MSAFATLLLVLGAASGRQSSADDARWAGCELGTAWPLPAIRPVPTIDATRSGEPWCLWLGGRRSCAPRASWVMRENRRAGTTSWCIPTSAPRDIQGYAAHVSAVPGETVTVFVSTPAVAFRVNAYRLGFYGGLGARLVWRSGWLGGGVQRVPAPAPPLYLVEAG